jgi:hypothetical protein
VSARAPNGTEYPLTLLDDGQHHDDAANDGTYGAQFTPTDQEGTYEFTFRATGRSRDGEPVRREAVRSKYIEGRTPLVPPGDSGSTTFRDCCERVIRGLWVIGILVLLLLIAVLILL